MGEDLVDPPRGGRLLSRAAQKEARYQDTHFSFYLLHFLRKGVSHLDALFIFLCKPLTPGISASGIPIRGEGLRGRVGLPEGPAGTCQKKVAWNVHKSIIGACWREHSFDRLERRIPGFEPEAERFGN